MPELPEVETFARSLRPHVVGRVLADVWGSGLPLRQPVDLAALRAQRGARVDAIERTGKYLLFRMSSGKVLIGHLGMSGYYLISGRRSEPPPHTHLRLTFEDGEDELRYVDPRRFGSVVLSEPAEVAGLLGLGPDPLGAGFTAEGLHAALRATRRDLKSLLLDQSVVAGLGNIYVVEALFQAGLRPTRRSDTVSRPAAARLHEAIGAVLSAAVERRGTTLSDGGYVDAMGQQGENQHHLAVYDRGGQPCRRCGTPVRRIVQGQRSTYFCPRCQR
jgi:formamidopyrimidine-DNA glycosylase